MIEVVSARRCIGCDMCVMICPTNVFDPSPDGETPVIARQGDCQTCFMCEAYCPVNALFVAPHACPLPASSPLRDEEYLVATGLLSSYRTEIGSTPGQHPGARAALGSPLQSATQVIFAPREQNQHNQGVHGG